MRRRVALACLLAVGMAALVCAQEGHPLSGTWSGDWGPTAAQRTHLTIVLNWDGKAVTGTINPGPNAVTIGRSAVNSAATCASIWGNSAAMLPSRAKSTLALSADMCAPMRSMPGRSL